MIKKIIHISDVHFRTYKRHDEYREILTQFIEEIRGLTEFYSYDELRIVIAGDLVHQKITISNELTLIVAWFLHECASICPVIVIAGNHDLVEDNRDRLDSLTPIIELMRNDNIRYLKESKCILDDNVVWCVYSIFENNQRPPIYDAIKELGKDKTYIGLFHAPVLGSKTALGYEFKDSGVSLDYFDGCDMVLLGDIHKRQSFSINNGKTIVAYPSSLIQQDFGEKINDHGYLLWDVETKNFEEKNIETEYGFYQFKITSLDDLTNGREELINK